MLKVTFGAIRTVEPIPLSDARTVVFHRRITSRDVSDLMRTSQSPAASVTTTCPAATQFSVVMDRRTTFFNEAVLTIFTKARRPICDGGFEYKRSSIRTELEGVTVGFDGAVVVTFGASVEVVDGVVVVVVGASTCNEGN